MTNEQPVLPDANLDAEEQEILAYLLRQEQGTGDPPPVLGPRPEGVDLPLSYAQQRLWFLQQLEPHSSAYNIPLVVRLRGPLDVNALRGTLQEIVRRHESLRTTFAVKDKELVQVIAPELELSLPLEDLSGLPGDSRLDEANRRVTAETGQPFDLGAGPLIRCRLLRLTATEHVLMLTMHHVVGDGWSTGILNGELTALYTALVAGKPSPLPPLPIQYADFARWQRAWLQGSVLQRQVDYWRHQLMGVTPLELPLDRPRPARQTYNGALVADSIPAGVAERLRELSRREGMTLAITMVAAFTTLMSRYSGQTDITIGSPIANRTRRELEQLIGFFVNSLVLRADLTGDPTVRELLRRVREVSLAAYENQDLPFDQLVQELRPERDLSRHPLFQVMFAVQNSPQGAADLSGLALEPFPMNYNTTHFDLECHVIEQEQGISLTLVYNTDLFEAATAQRMLTQFRVVLERMASDPEQRISKLTSITAAESAVIKQWTGRPTPFPREATVAELFEAQVERAPEAVAVTAATGDVTLTYGELNGRANQVAHYLRGLGVGPGVVVGLSLGRSPELVVALLGIVKAGGAYLPLDPEYPAERLGYMVGETEPAVVLAVGQGTSLPVTAARVVDLGAAGAEIARASRANPPRAGSAETLAYVMYTSGSTGKPKGTCVTQRNVVRLVLNTNYVTLTSDDVVLQYAPMAFDAATFEVWGCLLNGGRLVLAPAGQVGLAELGALIERERVSVVWLTAAIFHQLADRQLAQLRGVRQLLAGGEALAVPVVQRVLAGLGPEQRLINGYGPTENTTFTCCHVMTRESVVGATVPIGRPIANTQVYVLDGQGQEVPVGVPGELYAGGDGVALGYWRQPALTAERFVNDPHRGRLYRTGDRVRYRADGTLEFLGRTDQQVKVRGYRIELGEIETVLRGHPAVRDVAVLAREDQPGDKRLVAYVVPAAGVPPEQEEPAVVSDLRAHVQLLLPDYMVPSAFVLLATLPVTANGKLDRATLPKPTRRQLAGDFVAPRSPLEQQLAAMFAEVLGVDKIGIHDDFFDLGGHSLLATQIVTRIAGTLNVDLPLARLFQAPTVAGLAQIVSASSPRDSDAPRITRVSREGRSTRRAATQ